MTGGFFAILDDIALLLDDAAVLSKIAAKKTAGILGDDLAVNAEKAIGFRASRELPVLWAITKGSFLNKFIILPLAFLLSAFVSWLIIPILLFGGAYLSFEGAEKIYHTLIHHEDSDHLLSEEVSNKEEVLRREKRKIRSAIQTDFILSIEIIMIALGTVMDSSLLLQVIVVSFVALLATAGVYGIVALIVRMDDLGFFLIRLGGKWSGTLQSLLLWFGKSLVVSLPWVIRGLTIIGTIAMLLVGGGMFTHNIPALHEYLHTLPTLLADLLVGLVVGLVLILAQQLFIRLIAKVKR